jgi:soluble lytic murein transglycosylase
MALAALVLTGAVWAAAPARRSAAKSKSATKSKSASKSAAKTSNPVTKAAPKPSPTDLAGMVRAYRSAPTAARRAAIVRYAAAHPKESPLARFALGVADYGNKDWGSAIASLQSVGARLPQLADYTAWYLAAAHVEAKDAAAVSKELARVYNAPLPSPLRARAWVIEARSLAGSRPAEALRILREHAAALPQPDGDLALADALQKSGDGARAAQTYQRVACRYPGGESAAKADAALDALRATLGASFPAPDPDLLLRRADRLAELRDYTRARDAYEALADQSSGEMRDRARVRAAALDTLRGQPKIAIANLRALDVQAADPAAERLFAIADAYRRQREDDSMIQAVDELARYPKSPWRLKALHAAALRLWYVNRPDRYLPYFRAVVQDFPSDAYAAAANWRLLFAAHMAGERNVSEQMRDHVRRYAGHSSAVTTLYFLGRRAETEGDRSAARSWYTRAVALMPSSFYGSLARQRLAAAGVGSAPPSAQVEQFLASIPATAPNAPAVERNTTVQARAERARLLQSAGLTDLADAELRFAAATEGHGWLLGIEMASAAAEAHVGLRVMKSLAGDYLSLPFDQIPRKLWEPLFPLPWRSDLMASAEGRGLDPYILAGLIRQESEFNPKAVSRARAYGLTQVLPSTGRAYARRAGVARVTVATLTQPGPNLKLGATILKSLLDQYDGKWEMALAGYNAGPGRVAQWSTWATYREQAEFIESIPILETREYVQAVLRNADMYRRLYGGKSGPLVAGARK